MPGSGAVAVAELRGHTQPRLFTPPLPAHSDPSRADACLCGCGLNPDTSWGFECCDFLENVLGWELIPYQRWLYIHALEKGADGTGFRFRTVVVLISRQNGKTQWLKGLGLWRLYLHPLGRPGADCPAAKNVLIAAQGLEYAEATLAAVVDDVKNCPHLKREFVKHTQTNGKHRMVLRGKRGWRAVAANRGGGRSLSVDLAELDELREHQTWLAWNAIVPTTTARPYSQAVAASNAGDKTSVVLRSLRDGAIKRILTGDTADTQIGLFEWSVPEDVGHLERKYWPQANPALGYLPGHDEESLAAKAEAMADNIPGFKTEHLALDVETPILTTAGWKTIGTVGPGDLVYHPNGSPTEIVHATPVYADRECYEVETTDGRRVVCDADHLWTVVDRRRGGGARHAPQETVSTRELLTRGLTRNKTGGAYAYQLPRQSQIGSEPVDLPIDPYLLGAWLGDGTTGKTEITCIDAEADELVELIRPATVTSVRKIGNARRINFRTAARNSRDGFPARCRELGIWTSKRIPDIYLTAGTDQRLALLQGLCDTDGSIDRNGRVRFCSTRRELAEQVLYLARSLGWRATIRSGTAEYRGTVTGPAYYVCWTHDAAEPPPFRLRRKVARINMRPSRSGERTAISIRRISPVAPRPVRCIQVRSSDGLFLAGRDLLPTHNCQWVDTLAPGIIPMEHWQATEDPTSRRAEGAPVWAAVDVNFQRSRSYVAIASRRADGLLHIEVIAAKPGTDWIIPWFKERAGKFEAVAVQQRGAPASGLIEGLTAAGVPVMEWGGGELQKGCAHLFDMIRDRGLRHRPSPALDSAAKSTAAKTLGDAWVFDRKGSPVDASPLVACAAAAWAEQQGPPEPEPDPQIHEWPDEEEIAMWENEELG